MDSAADDGVSVSVVVFRTRFEGDRFELDSVVFGIFA